MSANQPPDTDPDDLEADAIDQAAGIPEPPPSSGGILTGLVLPIILGAVVLIGAFWWAVQHFGLTN